jgi:phenylacetate-CoA ligase
MSELVGRAYPANVNTVAVYIFVKTIFTRKLSIPTLSRLLTKGKRGEMLVTTLTKEGIPLLRYRTRDITA